MTQNEQIRKHLESGKSLTPLEALKLFNCFRLASRISDLKKEGMDIVVHIVERINEDGEKVRFAEYHERLKGGGLYA
jgi:hypothetical protein